ENAVDLEGPITCSVEPLTVNFADVSDVVIVDHHLVAVALVGAAHEEARAGAPVRIGFEDHVEVAELFIGQEDAPVSAPGRILLAGDGPIFDDPDAAGPVSDLFGVLVPASQVFSVEDRAEARLKFRLVVANRATEGEGT